MKIFKFLITNCTFWLLSATANAQNSYSNIFVFGDSLSDNGNFIPLFLPNSPNLILPPPYYGNRYSNGPLAVEVLAEQLHLPLTGFVSNPASGNNYAIAGATARGQGPTDLSAQVQSFLSIHQGSAPSDALYIVFIGGNDMHDLAELIATNAPKTEQSNIIQSSVKAIQNNFQALLNAGAKNILLVSIPDIGKSPILEHLGVDMRWLRKKLSHQTLTINKRLHRKIKKLSKRYSEAKIAEFNFELIHHFALNGSDYDINPNYKNCIVINYLTFNVESVTPECGANLQKINSLVYFDEVHLSARVNERLGRLMYSFIPAP